MTALFSPEWLEQISLCPSVRQSYRVLRRRRQQLSLFVSLVVPEVSPATRRRLEAAANRTRARHLVLAAADNHAVVVIVVPPTRDAGERDARQIRNEPDCLGRVAFTSTGFGKRRDTFENLSTWLGHLEAMGRKWRMG